MPNPRRSSRPLHARPRRLLPALALLLLALLGSPLLAQEMTQRSGPTRIIGDVSHDQVMGVWFSAPIFSEFFAVFQAPVELDVRVGHFREDGEWYELGRPQLEPYPGHSDVWTASWLVVPNEVYVIRVMPRSPGRRAEVVVTQAPRVAAITRATAREQLAHANHIASQGNTPAALALALGVDDPELAADQLRSIRAIAQRAFDQGDYAVSFRAFRAAASRPDNEDGGHDFFMMGRSELHSAQRIAGLADASFDELQVARGKFILASENFARPYSPEAPRYREIAERGYEEVTARLERLEGRE